jgi:hypothetical protein
MGEGASINDQFLCQPIAETPTQCLAERGSLSRSVEHGSLKRFQSFTGARNVPGDEL